MRAKIDVSNKWVLITGASSGIGAVYAAEFAKRGANLILVARSEGKLNAVAESLRQAHAIQVQVISSDLSRPEAPRQLFDKVVGLGLHVHGLVNNAGFAVYGRFHEGSLERNQEQILLNVFAMATLSQLFLPAMVRERSGILINVASTAAFQPLPYMANYGASKAFVLSFTEALWGEYQNAGLRIVTVCPGATETPFFDVVAAEEASVGNRDTPQNVVKTSFQALECNRSYVITGPKSNYWLAQAGRLIPRSTIAKTTEKVMRPRQKVA